MPAPVPNFAHLTHRWTEADARLVLAALDASGLRGHPHLTFPPAWPARGGRRHGRSELCSLKRCGSSFHSRSMAAGRQRRAPPSVLCACGRPPRPRPPKARAWGGAHTNQRPGVSKSPGANFRPAPEGGGEQRGEEKEPDISLHTQIHLAWCEREQSLFLRFWRI